MSSRGSPLTPTGALYMYSVKYGTLISKHLKLKFYPLTHYKIMAVTMIMENWQCEACKTTTTKENICRDSCSLVGLLDYYL